MSRLGAAFKAFTNPSGFNEHHERNFLTVLANIGFGKKNLKTIIDEGFTSNTHVYSIINRIAESAADIPLIIESLNSKGDIEIITEGDFFDFVNNPNPKNNYKSFTYQSMVYQLATGNEVQYAVQGIGGSHFSERWNLAPQYITPKVINKITGPEAASYKYNYSGTDYPLSVEEVMHLSKFNPDPASENAVMGLSPLMAAYRTLVASNEIITADASLIKNKGAFGLISSKGERPLTKEDGEAIDRSLKQKIGGAENFGAIKVTSGDVDFIKLAMSPADLQILESGVMKLRDLCSIYGAKSRMFNDPNGATFNNAKQDAKDFYINAVLPPLENDLDHFNKFFIPGWNDRDNTRYNVKLDVDSIDALQEDQTEMISKAKTRSEVVTNILTGIGTEWSAESAVLQLVDSLGVTEEYATGLVDIKPETNDNGSD